MTVKNIKKLLTNALLKDGEMQHSLYEYELQDILDDLRSSLIEDKDEYIFSVTVNNGHVAMVLIERSGELYINELARDKLKDLWRNNYTHNVKLFIPDFAKQLNKKEFPIYGVKTIDTFNA
jgi:hypothetical protein